MRRSLLATLATIACLLAAPAGASALTVTSPANGTVYANGGQFYVTHSGFLYGTCFFTGASTPACTPVYLPHSLSSFAQGQHTVTVHAQDGLFGPMATATSTFHVVHRAETNIQGTLPELIQAVPGELAFTTPRADATLRCALDGGARFDCDELAAQLRNPDGSSKDGLHTLTAAATVTYLGVDYPDATPIVRTFTLDGTAPTTTLTVSPNATVLGDNATVSFVGSDTTTDVTFECSIDGSAYAPCTAPHTYTGVTIGVHTASIRTRDAAGNVDGTPATTSWLTVADVDGDGALAPQVDCDDANAGIRPGAVDVAGNGVDEDCSGADTPGAAPAPSFRRATWKVAGTWRAVRGGSRASALRVTGLPAGAKVTVTCTFRKLSLCPFRSATINSKRGVANVLPKLRARQLPHGAVLQFRVTVPRTLTKTVKVTIRARKAPLVTSTCVAPGTQRKVRC